MILAITYGTKDYKNAIELNRKTAFKYGKVDSFHAYGPSDLDDEFKQTYQEALSYKRGGGYWTWKPYICLKAFDELEEGDYLVYADAGAMYVNKVSYLIDALEHSKQDVMCFSLTMLERQYSKRDALIKMHCDRPEFTGTFQYLATYIVFKKTSESKRVLKKWLEYMEDFQIVSDAPSILAEEYSDFVANRHDQTVWSLYSKIRGVQPFRDPNTEESASSLLSKDILERSIYPRIFCSHRIPYAKYEWQVYSKWFPAIRRLKGDFHRRVKGILPQGIVHVYLNHKNRKSKMEYQ